MVAFVQSANNSGTNGSTVTVTLGSATTAGNCLVVATQGADSSVNQAVSGITLGGSAGNFAALVSPIGTAGTTAGIVDMWADPNCAGGQTSVVVTWAGNNSHEIQVFVYEFSGLATSSLLDKSSTNFTTSPGGTWTSNATATTTQAVELWFGAVGSLNGTTTGPSSPWINSSQLGATGRTLLVGYQITSSTGTATYSGTFSVSQFSEVGVVTLHSPSGAAVNGTVQPVATFPVPRRQAARGRWGGPAPFTGFVAVAAPRQQPAPAPRRYPARAYVRFTPVTTTNAAPVAGISGPVPVQMVNRTEVISRVTGRVIRR